MLILICFALLSTVSCNGVYRFNRESIETLPELRKINEKNDFCPDGQTQCGDDQTCCQLPDSSYGCCPFPSAVCCSDHLNCCPKDTKCNLSEKTCDSFNNKVVTTLKLKVPAIQTKSKCPDGESQCGDDQTCCQLPDSSYGCCPFPSAVCCSDHLHCCPKSTKCNLSEKTCDSVNNKVVTTLKLKVPAIQIKSIICPDGLAQCGNDQTCCQLLDSSYGCCSFPSAVCCSDHLHCCPKSTKCNLSNGTCDSVNNKVFTTLKLKVPAIQTKSIICPDSRSQCGNDQTCCQLPDSSYGCCPFSSAVCCSDHLHCCPKDTKCNLSDNTCDSVNNKVVTTLKLKIPSIQTKSMCPDGRSQCGDLDTCCPLEDGSYSCCPSMNAVCCSDHIHCCPKDTKCNFSNGTCNSINNKVVTTLKLKIPSIQTKSMCPDDRSQCGDLDTCCPLQDGSYSCCPTMNAVCCSDKLHCCPQNTVCNLNNGTCDERKITKISLLVSKIQPVQSMETEICPGGKYKCKDGSTCCLMDDDVYGCCPYPSATCCNDKIHCCPSGTVCNLTTHNCENKKIVHNSTEKYKLAVLKTKSAICPDGQSQCDDGYTCCLNSFGSFGCCIGVNSVCCSDRIHCCPENTVCNIPNASCDSVEKRQMFSIKNSKTIKPIGKQTSCPDGSFCEEGSTCCPLVDKTYGCCSYTHAVCCSDHSHCCPSGTTCSLNTKSCDKDIFQLIFNRPFRRP